MPASDRELSTPAFTATAGASGGGDGCGPVATSTGAAGPRTLAPAAGAAALLVGEAAVTGAAGAFVGAGAAAFGAAGGAAGAPPQAVSRIRAANAAARWATVMWRLLRATARRPSVRRGQCPPSP